MLSEQKIIDTLKQSFPIAGGIGDDAAIFPLSATESYVITKDLMLEDIHFRRSYADPISLGYKALQVNLSDIAAMGAKAQYVLLGISIPSSCKDQYIYDFLHGFTEACHNENIHLIGGDTIGSTDKLSISVTVIGIASSPKFRTGANIGDIIAVVGNLGHAHLGLQAFEKNIQGLERFKNSFLRPQALLKEGILLGGNPSVTAMMDISDGLLTDLKKLCDSSGVAGELNTKNLENTQAFNNACKTLELDPLITMLTGGEDYGLLITVKPDSYEKLAQEFPLKNIGKIVKDKKASISFDKNIDKPLKEFSHFGEFKS